MAEGKEDGRGKKRTLADDSQSIVQNARARPVVALQKDLLDVAKLFDHYVEVLDLGRPPAVNRLVRVADDRDGLLGPGEETRDLILDGLQRGKRRAFSAYP